MGITTKEIADICGVSRGTVDRALNNRSGINEETRKLIMETAKKLGYRPHFLARGLVKGCTMTLGVIVFDLYNRFFAQLFNSIEATARDGGYLTYLTLTGKDKGIERQCIEHLAGRQVDGLILCSVNEENEYGGFLKNLNIPVVTVGNRIKGQFPFVGIDDGAAMQDAADCIASKGYTRIVYLSPPLEYIGKTNVYAQQQRFEGYARALGKHPNIESVVISGKDYLTARDGLNFKNGQKTAVLCSSDLYALEVLHYMKARNFKVPGDIGLMGFDNIDLLKHVEPSLATVSYPLEDIGAAAVELLLSMLADKGTHEDIILKHAVIEGKSL